MVYTVKLQSRTSLQPLLKGRNLYVPFRKMPGLCWSESYLVWRFVDRNLMFHGIAIRVEAPPRVQYIKMFYSNLELEYWKCKYNAYLYVTNIGNIIRNPRVPPGRNLLSRTPKVGVWTRCK